MDLSVPVLAEPESPREVIARASASGEARESTMFPETALVAKSDSRGGQVYPSDVDPDALKPADLIRAQEALTECYREYKRLIERQYQAEAHGVRGRRADYLPLNKWNETP